MGGVGVALGGSDAKKDAYARMILQLGQARNGSKKLSVTNKVREQMPETCYQYLGKHCTDAEIMFCSQIHLPRPTADDPLTSATVKRCRETERTTQPVSEF